MIEYENKEIHITQIEKRPIRCICDICHKTLNDDHVAEIYRHELGSQRKTIPDNIRDMKLVSYFHVETIYPERFAGDPTSVNEADYCPVCMTQVFDTEILQPGIDIPVMDKSKYTIEHKVGVVLNVKQKEELV